VVLDVQRVAQAQFAEIALARLIYLMVVLLDPV